MPALHDSNSLFMTSENYKLDRPFIDVPPGLGLQQAYDASERFSTLSSVDHERYSGRYDAARSAHTFRMGEVALNMSRILWRCQGDPAALLEQFATYWQGHDPVERPHGIHNHYQTTMFNFHRILWAYTCTPCEWFFSYLAAHRHLIAQAAAPRDDDYAAPFGRNRYYDYLSAATTERRAVLISYLRTDLRDPPYLPSLQRFYANGGRDSRGHFIIRDIDEKMVPFGSMTQGILINWLAPPAGYDHVFTHMDDLFRTIAGEVLPSCRAFLRAVFEIQYWYIHLMPCERDSLAVMNMFRHAMLAYYNRRQPDQKKWLPIAPSRVDVCPGLEALILQPTLEDFIAASFQELYCVDYGACAE